MTETDENAARPISVSELLARNGTIGAPPVHGRRRKRRGRTDSVTVAELTGEIPIVGDDRPESAPEPEEPAGADTRQAESGADRAVGEPDQPAEVDSDAEPVAEHVDEHVDGHVDEHVDVPVDESADESPDVLAAPDSVADVPAEEMRPDPVDDDDGAIALDQPDVPDEADDDLPAYLLTRQEPLFGGHTADGPALAESREPPELDELDEFDEFDEQLEAPGRMRRMMSGGWVVLQSVLAVAFGAALFVAFDELWKWNNIVALALSVLVILGLVVAVRIVRKTEDTASTLIAVGVGALITLGPLALLQTS